MAWRANRAVCCTFAQILHMSSAFVREGDEQWLHDVAPGLPALLLYLTRENNGIRVYEKRNFIDPKSGKLVHEMSNGFCYAKDEHAKWLIID